MRALRVIVAVAVAGCGFSFDRPSAVNDRRVLAIQADPPELTSGFPPVSAIAISALVGDVGDLSANVAYAWAWCLGPSLGANGRCPEDEQTTTFAQGEAPLDALSATLPVPPAAFGMLLGGGPTAPLELRVQLRMDSAAGELVAVKSITLTPQLPEGQARNVNPKLSGLRLGLADWPAGAGFRLRYGECPDDQKEHLGGDPRAAAVCTHEIWPLFDEAQTQEYLGESEVGDQRLEEELLRFSWFANGGTLGSDVTQEVDPRFEDLPRDRGLNTRWYEPEVRPTRPVAVWVVVRDGRGGVSWERRDILFE